MKKTTKVLFIEDKPEEVEKVRKIFAEVDTPLYEIQSIDRFSTALETLEKHPSDVILVDLTVPDIQGVEDLSKLTTLAHGIPVVVLGQEDDVHLAVEVLAQGAQDYLVKSNLNSHILNRVIVQVIERQRIRSHMQKNIAELQRLNQLKSDFISYVSHELHTPLTVMTLAVNNFLDEIFGKLSDVQIRWIQRIKANIEQITNLINDILDLSKLEAGISKLDWRKFDLCAVIERTLDNLTPLTHEKNIQLIRHIPSEPVEIFAAQSKIERVMINLITNSLKFTPQYGTIRVELKQESDAVRVEVSDTGSGIDPAKLGMIFERFLQLGKRRTTTEGAGLGLAICREIISIHKGKIWAESEGVGKGSHFIFTLPMDLQKIQRQKNTILIVENNQKLMEELCSALEGSNLNVITAKDGAEAIARIVSSNIHSPIHFLIVDLLIPIRNGIEVIKEMQRVNANTSILVITEPSNKDLLAEVEKYTAFGLLPKPFKKEELDSILQPIFKESMI